jgi:hypothetical protein
VKFPVVTIVLTSAIVKIQNNLAGDLKSPAKSSLIQTKLPRQLTIYQVTISFPQIISKQGKLPVIQSTYSFSFNTLNRCEKYDRAQSS